MRYAFVCDTPYQILSTISYVLDKKNTITSADLYVEILRCKNVDMKRLVSRVVNSNLFANVYILESIPLKTKNNLYKAYEWLCPRRSFIKSMVKFTDIRKKHYDVIGVTGPFTLQRNFISLFPNSTVYFLEDGSGSYNERIGVNLLSWRGELIQKILKRGPKYITPKKHFLYYPEFYEGAYSSILCKLNFPIDRLEWLKSIYDVHDCNLYASSRMILFGQPIFHNERMQNMDQAIISTLVSMYGNQLIMRPHPAENIKDYSDLIVDNSPSQWEIVCAESIDDQSILIGKYSTAQLVPKLIFNKEPYIVFIYKLFGINDVGAERGVQKLKSIYKDKSKIIIVETQQDLVESINHILEFDKQGV